MIEEITVNNQLIRKNIPYFTLKININKEKTEKLENNNLNDFEQETYDFCMKNKLEYTKMKNINDEIKALIKHEKYKNISLEKNKSNYEQSLKKKNFIPISNRKVLNSLNRNNNKKGISNKIQIINSKNNSSYKKFLNNKRNFAKKIVKRKNTNRSQKNANRQLINILNDNSKKETNLKNILSQKITIDHFKNNKVKVKRDLVLKPNITASMVKSQKLITKTKKNLFTKKNDNIKLNKIEKIPYQKKVISNKFKSKSYIKTNIQNTNNKYKIEKNVNSFFENNNINSTGKFKLYNTYNKEDSQNFTTIQNISTIKNNESLSKNLFSDQNENLNKSQKVTTLKKIFKLLDKDGDNLISPSSLNLNKLPLTYKKFLMPIVNELKIENESLTESEFIYICEKYFNNLDKEREQKLFNNENNKELFHKKIYEISFKTKYKNYFDYFSDKMKNEKNHINNSHSFFNSLIETHSSDYNHNYLMKIKDNISTDRNSLENNKIDKKQIKKICRSQDDKKNNNCYEIYYNSFLDSNRTNQSFVPYFVNYSSIFRGNPNLNYLKCGGIYTYSDLLNTKRSDLLNLNNYCTGIDKEIIIGFDFSNISKSSNTNYMPINYISS